MKHSGINGHLTESQMNVWQEGVKNDTKQYSGRTRKKRHHLLFQTIGWADTQRVLRYEGNNYSPTRVIALANKHANGKLLDPSMFTDKVVKAKNGQRILDFPGPRGLPNEG